MTRPISRSSVVSPPRATAMALLLVCVAAGCSAFESFDGLTGAADGGAACTDCDAETRADGVTMQLQMDAATASDTGTGSGEADGAVRANKDGGGAQVGFDCNGNTVGSCGNCNGKPQPCITCDASGNTTAFCDGAGNACRNDAPGAFSHGCACKVPADCPGSFQACFSAQFCHTCGEPNSNGAPCVSGGTCNNGKCN